MKAFQFTTKGQPVTICAISTGTVSMKTRAHTIRHSNFARRLFDVITDKNFTGDLPVYCWLIEHPEGRFLIDAGYDSRVNNPGYFRQANALERWFSSTQVTTKVKKSEEAVNQLSQIGITPDDIDAVIFTHLHVDHVGDVPKMRNAKFVVNEVELQNNSHAFLLPDWFSPVKVKLQNERVGEFSRTFPLTAAGDMHLVATPGHTKGHCSILLETDQVDILFAGDVVYDTDQLTNNTLSAPNDKKSSMESYRMIKTHGMNRPLIVLPSHDEKSVKSLEQPFDNLVGLPIEVADYACA